VIAKFETSATGNLSVCRQHTGVCRQHELREKSARYKKKIENPSLTIFWSNFRDDTLAPELGVTEIKGMRLLKIFSWAIRDWNAKDLQDSHDIQYSTCLVNLPFCCEDQLLYSFFTVTANIQLHNKTKTTNNAHLPALPNADRLHDLTETWQFQRGSLEQPYTAEKIQATNTILNNYKTNFKLSCTRLFRKISTAT
jgi:hypothetical protein